MKNDLHILHGAIT